MNTVGMMMPLVQTTSTIKGNSKSSEVQDNMFQTLLNTKQLVSPSGSETTEQRNEPLEGEVLLSELGSLIEKLDEQSIEELELALNGVLQSLTNGERIDKNNAQQASELLSLLEKLQKSIQSIPAEDGETRQLQSLLEEITSIVKEEWNSSKELNFYLNDAFMLQPLEKFQKYIVSINESSDKLNQFSEVFRKVEELLPSISSDIEMKKAAPKILELLERWTQLKSQTGKENIAELLNTVNKKELIVWKELVQSFEKREQIALKLSYTADAKVTVMDVSRWLEKALGDSMVVDKVNVTNSNLHTAVPLSKVEQYVIYTNQSNHNQPANQQLLEQFQQIMKKSNFSTLPNGTNQLSIRLQPNHLGDMMVRFTQVNGEMTVKILVATQTAKEMLEANIKQLKSMFSPHQVMIEKQEWNMQPAAADKGQNGQQETGHDQQSDDSNEHEHRKDDHKDTTFHEMLMNVKV